MGPFFYIFYMDIGVYMLLLGYCINICVYICDSIILEVDPK